MNQNTNQTQLDVDTAIDTQAASESQSQSEPQANRSISADQPIFGRKRFTFHKRLERRAFKEALSDRRAEARYDENGVLEADRRLANRLANMEKVRQSG